MFVVANTTTAVGIVSSRCSIAAEPSPEVHQPRDGTQRLSNDFQDDPYPKVDSGMWLARTRSSAAPNRPPVPRATTGSQPWYGRVPHAALIAAGRCASERRSRRAYVLGGPPALGLVDHQAGAAASGLCPGLPEEETWMSPVR